MGGPRRSGLDKYFRYSQKYLHNELRHQSRAAAHHHRGRRSGQPGPCLCPVGDVRRPRPGGRRGRPGPGAAEVAGRRDRSAGYRRVRRLGTTRRGASSRRRRRRRHPGHDACRADGGTRPRRLPHPPGETDGDQPGRRPEDTRRRPRIGRAPRRLPCLAVYAVHAGASPDHRQRPDRRSGHRRASGTRGLVAPGALVRPRQLAPRSRLVAHAAGQVRPRHGLAELHHRTPAGPCVVVRQPASLPPRAATDGCRGQLSGLPGRAHLPLLRTPAVPLLPRRPQAGELAAVHRHRRTNAGRRHRGSAVRTVWALRLQL